MWRQCYYPSGTLLKKELSGLIIAHALAPLAWFPYDISWRHSAMLIVQSAQTCGFEGGKVKGGPTPNPYPQVGRGFLKGLGTPQAPSGGGSPLHPRLRDRENRI